VPLPNPFDGGSSPSWPAKETMKYIYRCNACDKRWSTDEPLLTDTMLENMDISKIICMDCSVEIVLGGVSIEDFIVLTKTK